MSSSIVLDPGGSISYTWRRRWRNKSNSRDDSIVRVEEAKMEDNNKRTSVEDDSASGLFLRLAHSSTPKPLLCCLG